MKQRKADIQTDMIVRKENDELHLQAGSRQTVHGDLVNALLGTLMCSGDETVDVHLVISRTAPLPDDDVIGPFPTEFDGGD